jgi:hypothetical protein
MAKESRIRKGDIVMVVDYGKVEFGRVLDIDNCGETGGKCFWVDIDGDIAWYVEYTVGIRSSRFIVKKDWR